MGNDITPILYKYQKGVINCWAIRFAHHTYRSKGVAIYPTESLVANLVADGNGTHMKATNKYHINMAPSIDSMLFCNPSR